MNKEINIMKTITKKLSLVLMLVIGIIGCFTLFACGEDPDTLPEVTGYAVYVKLPDGTAAANVQVQVCKEVNGEETECKVPVAVNAEGKVEFNYIVAGEVYNVHLLNVPAGYKAPETKFQLKDGNKVVTITLVAE